MSKCRMLLCSLLFVSLCSWAMEEKAVDESFKVLDAKVDVFLNAEEFAWEIAPRADDAPTLKIASDPPCLLNLLEYVVEDNAVRISMKKDTALVQQEDLALIEKLCKEQIKNNKLSNALDGAKQAVKSKFPSLSPYLDPKKPKAVVDLEDEVKKIKTCGKFTLSYPLNVRLDLTFAKGSKGHLITPDPYYTEPRGNFKFHVMAGSQLQIDVGFRPAKFEGTLSGGTDKDKSELKVVGQPRMLKLAITGSADVVLEKTTKYLNQCETLSIEDRGSANCTINMAPRVATFELSEGTVLALTDDKDEIESLDVLVPENYQKDITLACNVKDATFQSRNSSSPPRFGCIISKIVQRMRVK